MLLLPHVDRFPRVGPRSQLRHESVPARSLAAHTTGARHGSALQCGALCACAQSGGAVAAGRCFTLSADKGYADGSESAGDPSDVQGVVEIMEVAVLKPSRIHSRS